MGFLSDIFGGGDDDDSGYKISDQEKNILTSLYENMEFMKSTYRDSQLPYDLMVVEGNKELYPQYFKYATQQIADSTTDLALNRNVKDQMAAKQLNDIDRQNKLAQIEYDNAIKSQSRYDTAEDTLSKERLGTLTADVNGVMGKATSDVAQAYNTQRASLARDQARLGVTPGSGMASEQNRQSALDFAKASALARSAARDIEIKRVDDANLDRTKANWSKDISLIQGGRQTVQNSTNYTNMLNGGFGATGGGLATAPQGNDLNASANAAAAAAANGPEGVYAPASGGSGNALMGAGATLGAAWLMK